MSPHLTCWRRLRSRCRAFSYEFVISDNTALVIVAARIRRRQDRLHAAFPLFPLYWTFKSSTCFPQSLTRIYNTLPDLVKGSQLSPTLSLVCTRSRPTVRRQNDRPHRRSSLGGGTSHLCLRDFESPQAFCACYSFLSGSRSSGIVALDLIS